MILAQRGLSTGRPRHVAQDFDACCLKDALQQALRVQGLQVIRPSDGLSAYDGIGECCAASETTKKQFKKVSVLYKSHCIQPSVCGSKTSRDVPRISASTILGAGTRSYVSRSAFALRECLVFSLTVQPREGGIVTSDSRAVSL